MDQSDRDARTVRTLVAMIKRHLAGQSPAVQGAVLADLTSLWIAGHRSPDPVEQDRMRTMLLVMHMDAVKQLIEPSDAEVDQMLAKGRDA